MEKICIVRRRKRNIQGVGAGADYISGKEMMPDQSLGVVLSQAVRNDIGAPGREPSPVGEVSGDKNGMISFDLTSEQCKVIQSGNLAQYVSRGMSKSTAFNVQQQQDGQISLNFYFDRGNTLRLLKAKQVCEMLQISRSFLGKLVKTKRLKSYKVGGLIRFSLEDILDFLTGDDCFENPDDKI